MTKKLRVILVVGVLEMFLAGLWLYLEELAREHPDRVAPDFHQTVGSTLGTVMGVMLGLGLALFFIASKNDGSRERRRDSRPPNQKR